jgi:hypothetical protein
VNKLIRKDEDGRLTEIDLKALRREGEALLSYIQHADPLEVKEFSYQSKLLPFINKMLVGSLKFPCMDEPYNVWLMMDGLEPELPEKIREMYFRFINRIQGAPHLSSASVIKYGHYVSGACEEIRDGDRYEWVEFED